MNPEQILIDTSAWIVGFKKTGSPQLKEFLKNSILAVLAATFPIIILELLQGCRTLEERDALKIKLESLDLLIHHAIGLGTTYELAFSLRKKGLTIPTADLIIAALAIENNSLILHQDEHFEMIAHHYPTTFI